MLSMTEQNELMKAGQHLKTIITHAQGRYVRATYVLKRNYPDNLSEKQVKQIQQGINQATLDIAIYRDLLRRCYEAIGVCNPTD